MKDVRVNGPEKRIPHAWSLRDGAPAQSGAPGACGCGCGAGRPGRGGHPEAWREGRPRVSAVCCRGGAPLVPQRAGSPGPHVLKAVFCRRRLPRGPRVPPCTPAHLATSLGCSFPKAPQGCVHGWSQGAVFMGAGWRRLGLEAAPRCSSPHCRSRRRGRCPLSACAGSRFSGPAGLLPPHQWDGGGSWAFAVPP